MCAYDLYEITVRGDDDFEALSSLEKDLYVLYLFQTIYEMEGYTHFASTYRNVHVPRLLTFLHQVAAPNLQWITRLTELVQTHVPSWDADDVDAFFCEASDDLHEVIDSWGSHFYDGVEEMWSAVDAYLRRENLGSLT